MHFRLAELDFYKDQIKGKTCLCGVIRAPGNNDISRMQKSKRKSLMMYGAGAALIFSVKGNFPPRRAGALRELPLTTFLAGLMNDIHYIRIYDEKTTDREARSLVGN